MIVINEHWIIRETFHPIQYIFPVKVVQVIMQYHWWCCYGIFSLQTCISVRLLSLVKKKKTEPQQKIIAKNSKCAWCINDAWLIILLCHPWKGDKIQKAIFMEATELDWFLLNPSLEASGVSHRKQCLSFLLSIVKHMPWPRYIPCYTTRNSTIM